MAVTCLPDTFDGRAALLGHAVGVGGGDEADGAAPVGVRAAGDVAWDVAAAVGCTVA